jgi:hypothetical protein
MRLFPRVDFVKTEVGMTLHASEKKLNEMNRLGDMGHFPAVVNAGATLNVMLTITLTWLLVPRYPQTYASILWLALVLCVNLLPVFLLRLRLRPDTVYRTLGQMDFVHDQHKFSDWVYVAASANMAFWVLAAWALFSVAHSITALAAMLCVALLATFSPVLLRASAPR